MLDWIHSVMGTGNARLVEKMVIFEWKWEEFGASVYLLLSYSTSWLEWPPSTSIALRITSSKMAGTERWECQQIGKDIPYPSRQRNYKCCITAYALVPVAKWNCVFSHSFSWCILLGKTSRSPTLMQRRPKVSFVSIKCVKSLLWCASQDSFRCTSHLLSTTSSGNEYYKLKMLMLCKQKAKMYSYRVCKKLSRTRAIWICPLHVWQQRRRRRIT